MQIVRYCNGRYKFDSGHAMFYNVRSISEINFSAVYEYKFLRIDWIHYLM